MSMTDPIADLITRIRNAQLVHKNTVVCRYSKIGENILAVLKDEGYIRGHKREEVRPGIQQLLVELKYFHGDPAIKTIKRVSKPGRRVYSPVQSLKKVCNGLGVAVLSTSKGVVSDAAARDENVGGEILFEVY